MIGAEPIWAAGRPGPLQGAGVLVADVAQLVEKLKNEAKVI